MKNIIRTTVLALAFGGLMLGTSCTDAFLDEQKVDQASSDYLNEPEGLASLANSLYQELSRATTPTRCGTTTTPASAPWSPPL